MAACSPPRPASSQSRAVCALVIVSSVVKVLEETMNSVSAGSRSLHRLGEIGAVDIGDEAEGHRRVRCSAGAPRRPSPGPRSEPPMPILTTLRMRLPVWPFQSPLRTRSANAAILSSTAWTSGTTFWPSCDDRGAARRAQGDVEHRALLGGVDLLAAEHGVDALAQARLLGKLQQQGQGFVGDAVLGVVEIESGGLGRRAARRARDPRRRAAADGVRLIFW